MEYKGYRIISDGSFGHKEIQNIGRGALPKELRGTFTTSWFAQKAINGVVERKAGSDGEANRPD